MYLSGLGAVERLWLYEYPGSPNCPASLTNGCYNTGLSPGCGDPKQFATYESMSAYAEARGEQKRQVSSAEEAMKICQPSQIPNIPPIQSQTIAPGYQEPTRTTTGARLLPTGASTPTAPQIITLPGTTTTVVVPAENPANAPAVQSAGLDFMPLLIGGGILAFFISRKNRR